MATDDGLVVFLAICLTDVLVIFTKGLAGAVFLTGLPIGFELAFETSFLGCFTTALAVDFAADLAATLTGAGLRMAAIFRSKNITLNGLNQ